MAGNIFLKTSDFQRYAEILPEKFFIQILIIMTDAFKIFG